MSDRANRMRELAETLRQGASGPAACMGGWCRRRNGCEHYAAADRREPAERLCAPGRDGVLAPAAVAETAIELRAASGVSASGAV